MWGGQFDLQSKISNEAVELLNANFKQISSSLPAIQFIQKYPWLNDTMFYTVWDIIIAEKAAVFITCIADSALCKYCFDTQSKFARYLLETRQSLGLVSSGFKKNIYNSFIFIF
jgi:hypothetical protein